MELSPIPRFRAYLGASTRLLGPRRLHRHTYRRNCHRHFLGRPSAAAPPHIQKELPPAFPWEASSWPARHGVNLNPTPISQIGYPTLVLLRSPPGSNTYSICPLPFVSLRASNL